MGFSRQEYWSGLPCPLPGGLPDPEIEHASPALAGRFFTSEPPGNQDVAREQLTIFTVLILIETSDLRFLEMYCLADPSTLV